MLFVNTSKVYLYLSWKLSAVDGVFLFFLIGSSIKGLAALSRNSSYLITALLKIFLKLFKDELTFFKSTLVLGLVY